MMMLVFKGNSRELRCSECADHQDDEQRLSRREWPPRHL